MPSPVLFLCSANLNLARRYNPDVERVNSQGIPLEDLKYVLLHARFVHKARRVNRCLLCCEPNVNEAGLCDACYTQLPEAEAKLAERWIAGVEP